MTIRIPQNTQNYLAVMLENKIQANRGESLFANIEGYRQKYIQEVATAPAPAKPKEKTQEEIAAEKTEQLKTSMGKALTGEEKIGGFGSGGPTPKTLKPGKYRDASLQNVRDITFGETDETGIGLAATAYGAGTLGGWLSGLGAASTIDKMNQKSVGDLIGKASESMGLSKAAILTNIGGQIEDITGKSWIDAQVGNIARGQLGLVAQGAGSPWVPFVMPGKKQTALPKYTRKSKEDLRNQAYDEVIAQGRRRKAIADLMKGGHLP